MNSVLGSFTLNKIGFRWGNEMPQHSPYHETLYHRIVLRTHKPECGSRRGRRGRRTSRPQPRPRHEPLIGVVLPPVPPGNCTVFRETDGVVEVEAVAAPEERPPLLLLLLEAVEHGAVAAAVARAPADHILGNAVEPGTRWKSPVMDRRQLINGPYPCCYHI